MQGTNEREMKVQGMQLTPATIHRLWGTSTIFLLRVMQRHSHRLSWFFGTRVFWIVSDGNYQFYWQTLLSVIASYRIASVQNTISKFKDNRQLCCAFHLLYGESRAQGCVRKSLFHSCFSSFLTWQHSDKNPWSVIPAVRIRILDDGFGSLPQQPSLSHSHSCADKTFRNNNSINACTKHFHE